VRGESSAQEKKALDRTRREEMHHSSEVHRMVRLQKSLLARNELAGFEVAERFYEIGSHAGLEELDKLLRKKR